MNGVKALGLFRIGPMRIAFPLQDIAEVVPGPLNITPLPEAPWHVLGAFSVRGRPVPAFDLATLIQPARVTEPLRPVDYVVILRTRVGELAIQVDEVAGIEEVTPASVAEMKSDIEGASPRLFHYLYTSQKASSVYVVLNIDALISTPEVQGAVSRATSGTQSSRTATKTTQPYLCLKVGTLEIAIPAREILHIHPAPDRLDSTFQHPHLRGFHRIQSVDTPIIQLASILGTTEKSAPENSLMITAKDHFHTGWLVQAPRALLNRSENDIQPLGNSDLALAHCFLGSVVDEQGTTRLILSPERMADLDLLVRLPNRSAASDQADQGTVDASGESADPRQYIVFRAADGYLACDIREIERVNRIPQEYSTNGDSNSCVCGFCTLDDRPVTLVNLGAALGRPPTQLAVGTPVIVGRLGASRFGLLVDRLSFLHRGCPTRLSSVGGRRHGIAPPFSMVVRARHEGLVVTACVLPIRELLERIQSEEIGPPEESTTRKTGEFPPLAPAQSSDFVTN